MACRFAPSDSSDDDTHSVSECGTPGTPLGIDTGSTAAAAAAAANFNGSSTPSSIADYYLAQSDEVDRLLGPASDDGDGDDNGGNSDSDSSSSDSSWA